MKIYFVCLYYLTNFFIHAQVFKIIGIYSICGSNYTDSEFTKEGYNIKLITEIFHSYVAAFEIQHFGLPVIDYISFDVCFNEIELNSLIVNLSLDSEFYAIKETKDPIIVYFGLLKLSMTSKIIAIITHLPEHMLQTVLSVFEKDNILVIQHHSYQQSTLQDRFGNFFNLEYHVRDIENFIGERPKWKEVIILRYIFENRKIQTAYEKVREMLLAIPNLCLTTFSIRNDTDVERLAKFM